MTPNHDEPRLQAPGKGLPFLELLIARTLFGLGRFFYHPEAATAVFSGEHEAIRDILRTMAPEHASLRALIPRLRGLEDSSRYWSVWMTLDHLRITNTAFAGIIASLRSGVIPEGKARIEEVKPAMNVGPETMRGFEASCEAALEVFESAGPDLRHTPKFPHPWFGPMSAAGWHFLAGRHMAIHRRQIEAILSGMHPNRG